MKRLRAVIYARVSSDRQKRNNTIASQLSTLPAWVKSMNWDLVGEYTDDGKSASTGKLEHRGGLAQLRADASKDVYDVVVFVDLDRITRSESWGEFGAIMGDFQAHGIKLASPTTGVLTLGDGASDMMVFMRIQIAAQDNKKRVETLVRGKREAAMRGCLPQGRVPYGLAWRLGARDASGWSFHPEHADIVRRIFARIVAGESCRMVATKLERKGVPTPFKGRWHLGVVRIVRGTYTRGEWSALGIPIKVPALVDDETWFAAQAALGVSKHKGLVRTKGFMMCEGLGTCEICQAKIRIIGMMSGDKKRSYRYYSCLNRTNERFPGTPRCTLPNTRVEQMDERVWAEIVKFFAQPRERVLSAILKRREHEQAKVVDATVTAAHLAEQLATLASKEGTYADMFDRDMLSPEVYRQKCAELTVRRQKLTKQLGEAQASAGDAAKSGATTAHLAQLVDDLRVKVPKATQEERRDLARLLIQPGGIRFGATGGAVVTLMFDDANLGEVKAPNAGSPSGAVTLRVVA